MSTQPLQISQSALLPMPSDHPIQTDTGYTETPDSLTTTGYTDRPVVVHYPDQGANVQFPSLEHAQKYASDVYHQLKSAVQPSAEFLGNEVKGAGQMVMGLPSAIADSVTVAPTADEQKGLGVSANPSLAEKAALALYRNLGEPIQNAAQWYGTLVRHHQNIIDAIPQDVLAQGIGAGAGGAVLGKVLAPAEAGGVFAEIRDLGFVPNAKLNRGRVPVQRRVDFNQGVDARILCKDPMFLRELSTICLKPLRIAFDHWGLRKPYEQSIRYAHEFGLHELSNYMLYNFHDTPSDLYQRMSLNVKLNEDLGIRIWSFPMRYQPTDRADRTFIGEKWTRYQLRSMQIILQATHGVVSGAPQFFKRAFGETEAEFHDLLLSPHKFIFNRDWYEKSQGQPEFDDFKSKFSRLSEIDRAELLWLVSSSDPRYFKDLPEKTKSKQLREVLRFYIPLPKGEEEAIWKRQRNRIDPTIDVPDDERAESPDPLKDIFG